MHSARLGTLADAYAAQHLLGHLHWLTIRQLNALDDPRLRVVGLDVIRARLNTPETLAEMELYDATRGETRALRYACGVCA